MRLDHLLSKDIFGISDLGFGYVNVLRSVLKVHSYMNISKLVL